MERGMGGGMDMTPPASSGMPGMAREGGRAMHMTFFWGRRVQVLFSGWPGDRGLGMYVLSLICVLVTGAVLECLSLVTRRLARPTTNAGRISTGVLLTALHALQMGLAYLLMLAVMSFNVGVFVAAVAGHALGYLISGSGLFEWTWSQPSEAHATPPNNGHALPSTKR